MNKFFYKLNYFIHPVITFIVFITILSFKPLAIQSGPTNLIELNKILQPFLEKIPGKVGFYYQDLTLGFTFNYNEDTQFNPASTIKVPIMVEAFKQRDAGSLDFKKQITLKNKDKVWGSGTLWYSKPGKILDIQNLVNLMITKSDNTATKILIEILGMHNINQTIKDIGMLNTSLGASNLLEAKGLNFTSARDMGLLMKKIYKGEILTKSSCQEMLALLKSQQYRWGIPKGIPGFVKVANKTGTLYQIRNDSGIVFDAKKPYVLSIFTQGMNKKQATYTIYKLSNLIYNWESEKDYIFSELSKNSYQTGV